jgi:hypothetical protein
MKYASITHECDVKNGYQTMKDSSITIYKAVKNEWETMKDETENNLIIFESGMKDEKN